MHHPKLIYRSVLLSLIAISIMLFPLSTGNYSQKTRAYAGQDFPTLMPVNATFTAPIGTVLPTLVPIPTLGPGQDFEAGDVALPDVTIVEGDGQFGYGTLEGSNDLYAIWVTDESGTHYTIVHKKSDILWNELDPENGFVSLIRQRNSKFNQISLAADNRDIYKNTAKDLRWGTIVVLGGAGVCAYFTLGFCLVLIGLGGGGFWSSLGNDRDANIQQNLIRSYDRELEDFEARLIGGFLVGEPNEPKH